MTSVAHSLLVLPVSGLCRRKHPNSSRPNSSAYLVGRCRYQFGVCHSSSSNWEPAPVSYAVDNEPEEGSYIFKTMNSSSEEDDGTLITTQTEEQTKVGSVWIGSLRKPLWLLGPMLLLITGVIPSLWLSVSSIFLGPNIASLLSLIGLDCIFNLGASLFLLMADYTARSRNRFSRSRPPSSYRIWNTAANVAGFVAPISILLASEKGLLQPQIPGIAFGVMLAPYLLLLSVQMITESLTWHWESPVWLVTPVVYEAYRLVQLMRGLKLGAELGSPAWSMDGIRGLVCGWVVVLGVQLMRVAWYAGFTAYAFHHKQSGGGSDPL